MNDTITAIATPSGHGALAVIRVSGSKAGQICNTLFQAAKKKSPIENPWQLRTGLIIDPESHEPIDEVVAVFYEMPRSYTGEDMVEFTCHGNPLIAESITSLILKQGARLAEPGEFTRRAFENGRIDLSRAEAVALLTSVESAAAARTALKLVQGGLSEPIADIRNAVVKLLTAIELDLDFPDETETVPDEEIIQTLNHLKTRLNTLVEAGNRGDTLRSGIEIVLTGRVNAGKSTLFNSLSGKNRAIVSDEPGTTRDILETFAEWGRCSVSLLDTAGLRTTDSSAENQAIQRATEILSHACIVLYLIDGSDPDIQMLYSLAEQINNAEIVVFWNKTDQYPSPSKTQKESILDLPNVKLLYTGSAKNGDSVIELKKGLTKLLEKQTDIGNAPVLMVSLRQKTALQKAMENVNEASSVIGQSFGRECAVPFLQTAYQVLGEITGDSIKPDVLGAIFSSFCIGK